MNAAVADCSIVIPWFFPEESGILPAEIREMVRSEELALVAPDLLRAEFGNVAWKKVRKNECNEEYGRLQITHFLNLPITYCSHHPLLPRAFTIACSVNTTVYDSLYLSLAAQTDLPLASLDRTLCSAAERIGVRTVTLSR